MKSALFLAVATLSIAPFVAHAQTNIALDTNGGVAIFGYSQNGVDTAYNHDGAGEVAWLNDGVTSGAGADTFGQPNPADGYVGATFTLSPTMEINSVVLYGRNFIDGGWFGYNGLQSNGTMVQRDMNNNVTNPSYTLTAAGLIAPTLQYTTDGGSTWITDTNVTNNYVTQFTGATSNGGSSTPPATFTLTVPLTGVDGIRLIGEDGGYASGGGGFLGVSEFEVFAGAVPEPSTWALMLGGVAMLVWAARRRALRA